MRWVGPAVLLLVGVFLLCATYPGADLVAFAARAQTWSSTAPPAGGLPWLHVAHPAGQTPYVADPSGRRVILRGAVAAGLVDWWSGTDRSQLRPPPAFPIDPSAYAAGRCPANSDLIRVPPLCADDFVEMRALGFDVVRLGLSWSLLEPEPGRYGRLYLDRIAQVVSWADSNGIYVILDMHQDGYSRYIPSTAPPPVPGGSSPSLNDHDGAPPWAVFSDVWPSERFLGEREVNPAVDAAFTSFWMNRRVGGPQGAAPGTGLQDHYIGALAMLARTFKNTSAVLGYDLFNEPWPGFIPPPLFEDLFLVPFYRRVIDALTGAANGLPCPTSSPALAACGYPDLGIHDRDHLMFVEPDHLRSQLDFQTDVGLPISSDPNLVYSIHAYTHKFTLDALAHQDPRTASYPPGGFEQSYADAEKEARSLGAALFVTEFGNEPAEDSFLLSNQLREQELHLVGSTYLPWKENCDLQPTWGVYAGLFGEQRDQSCAYDHGSSRLSAGPSSGCLRAGKQRLLERVWPVAMPAESAVYRYDATSGAFVLTANVADGAPETLLYVTGDVGGPILVTGGARLGRTEVQPGRARLVHIQPTGGPYKVVVPAGPLTLSACAAQN